MNTSDRERRTSGRVVVSFEDEFEQGGFDSELIEDTLPRRKQGTSGRVVVSFEDEFEHYDFDPVTSTVPQRKGRKVKDNSDDSSRVNRERLQEPRNYSPANKKEKGRWWRKKKRGRSNKSSQVAPTRERRSPSYSSADGYGWPADPPMVRIDPGHPDATPIRIDSSGSVWSDAPRYRVTTDPYEGRPVKVDPEHWDAKTIRIVD